MKGAGMLVVSLRGVNFGSWSQLRSSEQNVIKLSVTVSFRVAREDMYLIVNSFYLLNSCDQSFL